MKGNIIAFVHAKGTSTRVPSKNLRILGDKPLFCHAIQNALNAKMVDTVVIDSDSEEILKIGKEYEIVLQVIPTAPFLHSESIDCAINLLLSRPDKDSVAGVYEDAFYQWKDGKPVYYKPDGSIPNSFELGKTVYETTGLYINYTKAVLQTKRRLNPDSCLPYTLSKIESVDINTLEDFDYAEIIWKGLHG